MDAKTAVDTIFVGRDRVLSMIPIDGLDAVDAACTEALSEGSQSRRGVAEPSVIPGRQAMHIEICFRYVDANGNVRHLRWPMLVMQGVSHCVSVQASGEGGGRSHLIAVLQGQAANDPTAAGACYPSNGRHRLNLRR